MMAVFKFGWAKPVPVDMRNFKNPKKGMALTALAGPVSNVILCCIVLFIYGLVYKPLAAGGEFCGAIMSMISTTAYLSLALAVFNIIPIPPLDGSKVLGAALSNDSYYKLMRYEKYGMIILIVLVATGVLGTPLSTVTGYLFDKLFAIAQLGFDLVN
jgi:Zn-dependent protease